jgi:HlyD family type I secretion membrane fusion protein
MAVVAIFVVGGIAWSTSAPLAGAVIANGVIGFESKRKTIQHLEGGIIKEILVKEGDRVAAGATVLIIDDTATRARAEELANRIRTLAGEEARLHAERSQQSSITFGHPLLQDRDDPEVAAILEQQKSHFTARANNLGTRRQILAKRIDQLKKQRDGLSVQQRGVRTQLKLIREEADVVEKLVAKGYESRPRLLALLRTEAELVAQVGSLNAAIARSEEAVGETQIRIASLDTTRLEEVDSRLTEVQAQRVSAEKLYRETIDRLSRTRVISPIEGIVLEIRFKTVGGVVRPGEPILDIVPARGELIISARIQPIDIDEVSIGSQATVMFSAYQRRYLKRIDGEVIHVSPDAFQDEATGARYYVADVQIDRKQLSDIAPDLELTAGMPAEVFITTTERTLADYLIQPIRRSLERAFRES